jgi:predicted transcriptional regulator
MPGTPKQDKFMRAVAHGFKPDRVKAPARAVAQKWTADTRAAALRKKRPATHRMPDGSQYFCIARTVRLNIAGSQVGIGPYPGGW